MDARELSCLNYQESHTTYRPGIVWLDLRPDILGTVIERAFV